MMDLNRHSLLDFFVRKAQTWPSYLACWEGGAAANNRVDQFSDLDLIFCVEDDAVEESFRKIESSLSTICQIKHHYRVPEPTWSGHSQCYYQVVGMPEYFFIDVVVIKKTATNMPLEIERHGTPVVHFDKLGIVKTLSVDKKEFQKRMRERLKAIESSFPIYKAIVIKELHRQRALDALAFYRILSGFHVELTGMKYRPFHYDFGLRYAHVELPEEIQDELSEFSYVIDIDDVRRKLEPLIIRIEDLVAELGKSD